MKKSNTTKGASPVQTPQMMPNHGDRGLHRPAILFADKAPVPAGLLPGKAALFKQAHTQPALGKIIGSGGADDSTADNDDVVFFPNLL